MGKIELNHLKSGAWLGIDVGSTHKKVCSFCLIESDGAGKIEVSFEKGPAGDPYPKKNTKKALIEESRAPTYLKEEVEAAIQEVLDRAELVARWLEQAAAPRSAVAVDAPVALAVEGSKRLTEKASSQSISTPDRETFEADLGERKDPFLRINVFWKCVGFAVYRHLAARLDTRLGGVPQETIAAWTCAPAGTAWRIRETFPSDVYKRANGQQGTLRPSSRNVLRSLVATEVEWRGVDQAGRCPAPSTLKRLKTIRDSLRRDLEAGGTELSEMRRRGSIYGDLWDAFTCGFTLCCEDHDGAELHGWSNDGNKLRPLRSEGAILTVRGNRHA